MTRQATLRISGRHHGRLEESLFPGDDAEAVAIALGGVRRGSTSDVLCVQEIHPVPREAYRERTPVRASWRTDWLVPLLAKAADQELAVAKIHSHPTGHAAFSELDDRADQALFPSLHGWIPEAAFHASLVMLPGGKLFGRTVSDVGAFAPLHRIAVAGDLFRVWGEDSPVRQQPWEERNAQALGAGTTSLLKQMRIGIVGCSGTGSFVVEELARLGVGELVLVDPDKVGPENLNRIIWATAKDIGELKVRVAEKHLGQLGLGTKTHCIPEHLATRDAVNALADCDAVFGCVDSHDGRRLLNKLSTFYVLPYIDVGVRLDADGAGGLDQISGAVHYLQPGGSSLLSRNVTV